jgi:hypothetical protein
MAFNVGAASIVVKVITLNAQKQLQGLNGSLMESAKSADSAREKFKALTKTGYLLGPTIATVVGALSALIGSLGSVAGVAGGAGASLVVLGNVFASFGLAMLSAKIAMGGVMQALGQMGKGGGAAAKNTDAIRAAQERLAMVIEGNQEALINANKSVTEAQINLNEAFAAGREELQQLGFAAEEAALAELGAGMDLERAREQLARVQDLPPNSRLRREAELAFAQAELQYRQAVDTNADLAAEQEKYSQTGVDGTEQVIRAREQLAESEANLARVVRDGLRQQIEAERALQNARNQATAGGGADPFANLTKSQKDFVQRMYALKPLFTAVKEQVSSAFLPLLGNAMENFAKKVLPTVGDGLAKIGGELGKAAERTSKFLSSAQGLDLLDTLFSNSARLIGPMSDAMGQLFQAFIKLINAAAPVAETFVGWIRNSFTQFNEYLDELGNNKLTDFFTKAGESAAVFGNLFGEIFRYIGQLITVNLGEGSPGYDFVKWMGDGLRAANDIRDSRLFGSGGLADYFEKVNENSKKILSSLGALGDVFLSIGTNQNIGKTFVILEKGAAGLTDSLNSLIDASPSLAKLFNTLIGIAEVFTDSASIKVFFDILNAVASAFLDFISLPPIKAFIDFIGPIAATFLAIGQAISVATFALNVIIGTITVAALAVDGLIMGVGTGLTLAFATMKAAVISAAESMYLFALVNPVLTAIIVAVALVAGGFVLLNNHIESTAATSEDFANAINNVNDSLTITNALTKKVTLSEMLDPSQINKNAEAIKDLNKYYDDGAVTAQAWADGLGLGLPVLASLVNGTLDFKSAQRDTTNAIHDFNNAAAELPAAQVVLGLQQITDAGNASRETTLEIINTNANLRASLVEIANQAGITASDENLVTIATNDMKNAAMDAALGLPSLGDALRGITKSNVDLIRAQINTRNAFKSAKTQADELGVSLKKNGELSDKAMTVALDFTDSIYGQIDAMHAQGKTGDEIKKVFDKQKESLVKLIDNMGLSEEAARKLGDELLGNSGEIETVLKQRVDLDVSGARQEIQSFANYVSTQFKGKLPTAIVSAVEKFVKENYSASIAKRFGEDYFATGGMVSYAGEGIYSGRQGGIHKFAEPETGWEAYISGRKGSEGRNRAILTEAAGRLGMNIGGGGISITINPSAGMDETAIATKVSQEITKMMRKGSIQ